MSLSTDKLIKLLPRGTPFQKAVQGYLFEKRLETKLEGIVSWNSK
ncbi:hypothetical protein VCRA2116O29_190048 [Vibrio crassostreae]|nr:hypothetical protein VCRA2114O421_110158 [Vibrio crassostreae]CAK1729832.1 hypothetical protein VCRA2113O413_120009 [Vibrio crassostreae]CAK1744751.1 hypothetical protein VCRA2114O423_120157 [Vibrio crassostreae]CAK2206956.1 hypothetical protein VCRA2114O422_90009 [Vibrio crassostreae]CAK2397450.1 hypothetical protein VCRA2110O407_110009 [Vibrio crassostreae]